MRRDREIDGRAAVHAVRAQRRSHAAQRRAHAGHTSEVRHLKYGKTVTRHSLSRIHRQAPFVAGLYPPSVCTLHNRAFRRQHEIAAFIAPKHVGTYLHIFSARRHIGADRILKRAAEPVVEAAATAIESEVVVIVGIAEQHRGSVVVEHHHGIIPVGQSGHASRTSRKIKAPCLAAICRKKHIRHAFRLSGGRVFPVRIHIEIIFRLRRAVVVVIYKTASAHRMADKNNQG